MPISVLLFLSAFSFLHAADCIYILCIFFPFLYASTAPSVDLLQCYGISPTERRLLHCILPQQAAVDKDLVPPQFPNIQHVSNTARPTSCLPRVIIPQRLLPEHLLSNEYRVSEWMGEFEGLLICTGNEVPTLPQQSRDILHCFTRPGLGRL